MPKEGSNNISNNNLKIKKEKKPYEGHRKRLKDLFLNNYNENFNFSDEYLLEMLMFYAIPRKDTKQLSKDILKKYNSLNALLQNSNTTLSNEPLLSENMVVLILLVQKILESSLKTTIKQGNILANYKDLVNYCRVKIANKNSELLVLICLDSKNKVINEQVISFGGVDSNNTSILNIIKQSLYLHTKKIILVHNHPSGNSKPSIDDIQSTENLINALEYINIELLEHIIITSSEYYSFRENLGHLWIKKR